MNDPRDPTVEAVLPVVEEQARLRKRVVETGRVRVHTRVEEKETWLRDAVTRERVSVERVPIDRNIDAMPPVREEGEVTIVPVVEEVLVVEKRLRLVEEIHIRKTTEVERVEEPVLLRQTAVDVERLAPQESVQTTPGTTRR